MAKLTVNVYATGSTTAQLEGTWQGDAGSAGARYLLLEVGGESWATVVNNEGGSAGSTCTFDYTITGLDPGTTYFWKVTLAWGIITNPTPTAVTASGTFTTDRDAPEVTPWSWTSSNGSATATQTKNAYAILQGTRPADDFSHLVWNDLVDKIAEARNARSDISSEWSNAYATKANTKVSAGGTLSAVRYNSIRYNINNMEGADVPYVSAGDVILGSYIISLTNTLNQAISDI